MDQNLFHLHINKRICLLFGVLFVGFLLRANAQVPNDIDRVKSTLSSVNNYNQVFSPEKIYLNFDKPFYAAGDTAWFKAYVLAGDGRLPSDKSAKLHVELLGSQGKLIQQLVLPVFNGLAQGYIPFDVKTITNGIYTVRAYTNWQQNFGSAAFFYKQLPVGQLGAKTWLLTQQTTADKTDSNRVHLALHLNDAKGLPIIGKPVSLKLQDGGKTVMKTVVTTSVDGSLNSVLTLPDKINKSNLNILVEDRKDKNQSTVFPFYPSGNGGDIDLQFMPESGSLVAGVYSRVGFKAIGEDGLGRDMKGVILNSKGEEAAMLETVHSGMGSFMLAPQPGETYTAKLVVNGKEKRYALPSAKTAGMVLRVDGISHPDELYVYISGIGVTGNKYKLLGLSGGKPYLGSTFTLNAEGYFNTHIFKSKFPTGILSLTILGEDDKPVAQRAIFIDHHDNLQLAAVLGQPVYQPQDSVCFNLKSAFADGKPAVGSFSVSVMDDAQVKDSLKTDNIQSHILLASELKGNIENPAWYFEKGDEKLKEKALDNLIITQGWQGFDWGKLNAPVPNPVYAAEPDISVNGSLKNLFGKPAVGLKVALLANGKQPFLLDTVSDKMGKFTFRNLPITDTVAYTIKLHNNSGASGTAAITVDGFVPTNLSLPLLPRLMPWNLNTNSNLFNYMRSAQEAAFSAPEGTKLLNEVNIKDHRNIQDVNNEFAVQIDSISEKTLIAANKMTLMDLLYKELKGSLIDSKIYAYNIYSRARLQPTTQFVVLGLRINDVIVDRQSLGELTQSLRTANIPPKFSGRKQIEADLDFFEQARTFFNILSAEDIKSVKVFRGMFLSIVITTRSGKGLISTPSYGTYAYHPLPMQLPRQFYTPKYTVPDARPDLRSTIYWEPNLITDENGNAKLSFYAGYQPGTYTVTIEGTDMRGHFGVSTTKIKVADK